jgi:GrpB-like predicted nucleotidyltransferase (UPF0157 family)
MDLLAESIDEKYVFFPYSKDYPKVFQKEKRFISKLLSQISKKEIHHIGSTSVPNLGGKKIIDVIVVVPKSEWSVSKKLLKEGGFVYYHTMKRKRSFFYKYYLNKEKKVVLVHLHITYFGSGELEKALAFRDYLINFPSVRKQYELIKKRAFELHPKNRVGYVEFKRSFVESTLKDALLWWGNK